MAVFDLVKDLNLRGSGYSRSDLLSYMAGTLQAATSNESDLKG